MPIRNDRDHWGGVSIALHWLTFALILGLAPVGYLMQELPNGPFKVQVFMLHKSFGLTVLGISLLRLLWRLFAGAPEPVPGMPRWQELVAKATHGLLYALVLAIPMSGWLFNSAAGFPLRWFGLFGLPKLSGYDPALKEFAAETHETLFLILAGVVLLHAAAAIKHHYQDRDRTLMRMWPWIGEPGAAKSGDLAKP